MYQFMDMIQQPVSDESGWAVLALRHACPGRAFPTRQELGLGLQQRRMTWLRVQGTVEAVEAQKALDALPSVADSLSFEERSRLEAALRANESDGSGTRVSELFKLALHGVDQALDWLCYISPLEKGLHSLSERYGCAWERVNASDAYYWVSGDDGMKALCEALGSSQEDQLIREMALRVLEAMGINVAAPADLVLKRDVGRYATEERRSSMFSAGHCYFYRLPHDSERYLLLVIPDDRFKRFRQPGCMYLVSWPLQQAKEEAEKLLHPALNCFGSEYIRAVEEEPFVLNAAADHHDPRGFWHLIGDEGLKKVAEHLELRKQFPNLSGT